MIKNRNLNILECYVIRELQTLKESVKRERVINASFKKVTNENFQGFADLYVPYSIRTSELEIKSQSLEEKIVKTGKFKIKLLRGVYGSFGEVDAEINSLRSQLKLIKKNESNFNNKLIINTFVLVFVILDRKSVV